MQTVILFLFHVGITILILCAMVFCFCFAKALKETSTDEDSSSVEENEDLEKQEFRNSICYFCGSPFANNWRVNNAEDFRLHPETQGKVCCPRCNKLVTSTNRNISLFLKGMPMNEEDFGGNLLYLEEAAENLLDFVKEERNARDKIYGRK